MTDMFEDWKRVFGSKLKDRQAIDVRTAELWTIALQQLKITPKEFNQALAKSITLEWPPTAPADFLALARTGQLGEYMDSRKAYEHAVDYSGRLHDDRPDWQHETIYETAKRVGFSNLAIKSERFTWPEWQNVYAVVCSEHKNGAEFQVPQNTKQLEHKREIVLPGTEADQRVNAMLAKFLPKREAV